MPYIPAEYRERYQPLVDLLQTLEVETAGDLNYLLTVLCDHYIGENGLLYSTINRTIGALECAKLELYRRIAAPYEDTKVQTNGDVYTINKKDNQ